ncbi:ankyrin [Hyaloscypha bicolor E]|uniref:Ankyrin n=1 Tax=Hyaloscypha bicolor E TaxID=1095630 RepID=A0A2J6SKZ9_9HELO|nr:ankyrin [Hyaloscypha bicolor E]PMD51449.1 ankyrin [Hyaloscypha bicolor E]
MTLLHWAGRAGSPKILRLMLDRCRTLRLEEKDAWGWTPLLWAAYHGNVDVLGMLIDFDANKNVQDPDGRTPLSWAANEGHADAVICLLAKCARRVLEDKDGKTARDWAKTDEIRALFDC